MKRSSSRVVARKFMTAASKNLLASSSHKHHKIMSTLASATCQKQQRRQFPQRHQRIMDPSTDDGSERTRESKSILITPPPSPQLLLEGDEMYISSDGKSHTYYRLKNTLLSSPSSSSTITAAINSEYVLEEAYDIENARKEITLLQRSFIADDNNNSSSSTPPPLQLSNILSFPLQEINHGIQTGAGTGSITWESSIVMGLYFGLHPEQLVNNKTVVGSNSSNNNNNNNSESREEEDTSMTSLTLTEINRDIIDMLRYNTASAASAAAATANPSNSSGLSRLDELHIEQMDWFDFLVRRTKNGKENHHSTTAATTTRKKYDTIIASDCIYLPSQIQPLSETIVQLLERQQEQDDTTTTTTTTGHSSPQTKKKKNKAKAHIFSPYNRVYIPNLIQELRSEGKNMNVHVETIELSKFRCIKSNVDDTNVVMPTLSNWLTGNDDDGTRKSKNIQEEEDVVASSRSSETTSRFLHITASFIEKEDGVMESENSDESIMTDID